MASGRPRRARELGDFGAKAGFEFPRLVLPDVFADADQAFVKFLGKSDNREPVCQTTIKVIKDEGCHRFLSYRRRPVSVEDCAVMFIARLTNEPDIRIFGRAIGMKYHSGRDDASAEDIALRPWKREYSKYIRVHHAEFVAGTLANSISLYGLMDELGSDSFASTQRHAACGTGNTNPRHAFMQQPAVELSSRAIAWLGERLQAAFDAHGKVPQDTLDQID